MSKKINVVAIWEQTVFLAQLLRYVLLKSYQQEIIAEGHAAAQIINQV